MKELEDKLKELRKAGKQDAKLKALEERFREVLATAREARDKAENIENAAHDLKAVNPNRAGTTDKRKPAGLMEFIAAKGKEADQALSQLAALTKA